MKGKFIQTSAELKEVHCGSKVSCLCEKCALLDDSGWIPFTIGSDFCHNRKSAFRGCKMEKRVQVLLLQHLVL